MKKASLILSFLLLSNLSFALSPLPRNSYLRLGDNQKEVKILQQILNSDRNTEIADVGPGSPGNESWYFGVKTEEALKKFQEKNNLEVTGRIDFKTWKKINDYVLGISEITTNTTNSKIPAADNKVKTINEQNKKDFEESKKLSAEKKVAETNLRNEENKSFIDNLLDKYTGFFYTNKGDAEKDKVNSDIYSNNYSAQTPYLNPSTGMYSSNPTNSQQPGQQPQNQPINNNLAGQPGLNPFLPQQTNPYVNYGPPQPGAEVTGGRISAAKVNKIGQCRATSFAHATLAEGCVADRADQQNNQKSASGLVLSRTGVPAIPTVALWAGSFGDAVEVKDLSTGKCKAFPILERGPGEGPLSKGVCIDLTGSAIDILKGRTPCKTVGPLGEGKEGINQVQYAIVSGEKIQPGQTKECTHLVKQN